jgi:hypothetical protein
MLKTALPAPLSEREKAMIVRTLHVLQGAVHRGSVAIAFAILRDQQFLASMPLLDVNATTQVWRAQAWLEEAQAYEAEHGARSKMVPALTWNVSDLPVIDHYRRRDIAQASLAVLSARRPISETCRATT